MMSQSWGLVAVAACLGVLLFAVTVRTARFADVQTEWSAGGPADRLTAVLARRLGRTEAERMVNAHAGKRGMRVEDVVEMIDEVSQVAILRERQRLAQDLHDSVTQTLFSMTFHMRTLELVAAQEGRALDGRFGHGLAELRSLTEGALSEMRAALYELRPQELHEDGLAEAIRKQAAAVAARTGLDVRVRVPEQRLALDDRIEAELFRVVREAMHNCVKHASPSSIEIRLDEWPEAGNRLVVEVADDGVGFDPGARRPGSMGLTSMRDRMRRIGGLLTIDCGPAGSTTVRAVLPDDAVFSGRKSAEAA